MRKNTVRLKILLFVPALLAGLYSFLTAFSPSNAGSVGQLYYTGVLIPVFGHAAKLFGVFVTGCAFIFLFSRRFITRLLGFACLALPAFLWIDRLYITAVFPAKSYLTALVESHIVAHVGNSGLWLIELVSVVAGLYFSLSRQEVTINDSRHSLPDRPETHGKPIVDKVAEEDKPVERVPVAKIIKPAKKKKEGPEGKNGDRKAVELDLSMSGKRYVAPKISQFSKQPTNSIVYGEKREQIKEVFASLGVEILIGKITGGPSVEQYEISPGKGVKLAQIKKLEDDLSLALKSKTLITFNGDGALCVEVPIRKRQTVYFRRLLESLERSSFKLPVALGVNASYATYSFDLAELPHLLIAGTTGSGKSILVKSILASLMFSLTPNDVRLVMVDPKRVDFALFNDSPFLAREVVTDINMADSVLKTLVQEMENRYDLLEVNNAANISQFNDKAGAKNRIPYIVVVVDEFADLIMADKTDIADNIIRIAQKARACGIHLILATQRPSAEVISGLIKANVPGKIGLSVSSSINSKIIIDRPGAEKLLGKGDMIFISPELKEGLRLQGAFISDDEVKKFTRRSTRS